MSQPASSPPTTSEKIPQDSENDDRTSIASTLAPAAATESPKQDVTVTVTHPTLARRMSTGVQGAGRAFVWHLSKHFGAGVMAAVAYFDPGNWSVDMLAGSQYGYALLSVVLLAGLGAVLLQVLAHRLGCVTGLDLAAHCHILFANHPRHPRLVRYLVLYPLYAISEIAIIATDLAELLGSAIGLCLLFPRLPLFAGVLVTSVDVFIILALGGHTRKGRPVRAFEALIIAMVLATFVCFIVLTVRVEPIWPKVFRGYVPSETIFAPGALYTSIGILGATVMPHALYLGSSMATLDRVSPIPSLPTSLPSANSSSTTLPARKQTLAQYLRRQLAFTQKPSDEEPLDKTTKHGVRRTKGPEFIRQHMGHGIVDIVTSLLGFALLINSAILILAATVFFYKKNVSGTTEAEMEAVAAGLFDAAALIRTKLGTAASTIFALALLFAGQSASITATLSGQIVSEGFISWRLSPFYRRLITRLLGLIPATVVAVSLGQRGIDTLLVASQVTLSIVLPFVIFPLVWLTSSRAVMTVRTKDGGEEGRSYANGWVVKVLGYGVGAVVLLANGYVIVQLARGKT